MLVSSAPSANGNFHLYLADASRRKIAALWGGNEEKLANGYLFSTAAELLAAAETVLAGLNERIDVACQSDASSVPVFAGIAALSDAINKARGEQ